MSSHEGKFFLQLKSQSNFEVLLIVAAWKANKWRLICEALNTYIHMYKILSISLGVCTSTNFGSGKVWHNLPLSVFKSFALQFILNSEAKCFIAKQYKLNFVIYFY